MSTYAPNRRRKVFRSLAQRVATRRLLSADLRIIAFWGL